MHVSTTAHIHRFAAALVVAIGLTTFVPVHAGPLTWNWSWSSQHDNGNGTLTTNPLSGQSYVITGMSGTWDGNPITGLLAPQTCCESPPNDNLLLAGSPQLDVGGVAFSIPSGNEINLYYLSGIGYFSLDESGNHYSGRFSANQTSVPEPGSLALFGTALGMLALLTGEKMRRRKKACSGQRGEG